MEEVRNMELMEQIRTLSEEYYETVRSVRRHLHMHPELSFHEKETSDYLSSKLEALGLQIRRNIGGLGFSTTIGDGKGPIMALRADMDALPIQEQTSAPYKSLNKGVMHACGHDAHSASLIGAAIILNKLQNYFSGTIQFIFQPAEEVLPGGASLMIADGLFKQNTPMAILGQHVSPELSFGKVGFRKGAFMASSDELHIRISGRGGHAARPHEIIDPVLIASHLVVALQQIVSRRNNPQTPSVLSIGRFIADGTTNVIPSEVELKGTFRTFDELWRVSAHEEIQKLATGMVESMGGKIDLKIIKGYPVLKNDEALTSSMMNHARAYLGESNVLELDPRATAEDFAYYTHLMPGCFYRLGTASPLGDKNKPVHHPEFDIHEDSLKIGSGLMAWLAISALLEAKKR
jgi:amidohydrolase